MSNYENQINANLTIQRKKVRFADEFGKDLAEYRHADRHIEIIKGERGNIYSSNILYFFSFLVNVVRMKFATGQRMQIGQNKRRFRAGKINPLSNPTLARTEEARPKTSRNLSALFLGKALEGLKFMEPVKASAKKLVNNSPPKVAPVQVLILDFTRVTNFVF